MGENERQVLSVVFQITTRGIGVPEGMGGGGGGGSPSILPSQIVYYIID